MHEELSELFKGSSDSFIKSTTDGRLDERGKKVTTYTTVNKSITKRDWKAHLDGKVRIGVRPERDGKCRWGCIDIDPSSYKNYSQKKYVDIIRDFKLPLVPVKSKSGGLHIFVFLNEWVDANKVADKLLTINNKYFLAQEIFPCNKALNMPYQNMDSSMEFAYNNNNNPVLIQKFIQIAKEKTLSPEEFFKLQIKEYEPEKSWKHFPPCVQK